jgi:hypothetical protein
MRRIVLPLLALAGCPAATDLPAEVSGRIEVDGVVIGSGDTVTVTGDVEIVATGDVTVDGSLVADGEGPWNIVITADGDVTIAGTVRAGDANDGAEGGDVSIASTAGDITVSGTVAAGDGADGVVDAATLGAGWNGGDVSLFAEAGTLTLSGTVELGTGGDAAALSAGPEDFPLDTVQIALPNLAGAGGAFDFGAGAIVGFVVEEGAIEDVPEDADALAGSPC